MEPEELLIIHTATIHTRPQLFMCAPCLDMLGASMVRDFSVTAVHACMHSVWMSEEQAWCVTFQSQQCMQFCTVPI